MLRQLLRPERGRLPLCTGVTSMTRKDEQKRSHQYIASVFNPSWGVGFTQSPMVMKPYGWIHDEEAKSGPTHQGTCIWQVTLHGGSQTRGFKNIKHCKASCKIRRRANQTKTISRAGLQAKRVSLWIRSAIPGKKQGEFTHKKKRIRGLHRFLWFSLLSQRNTPIHKNAPFSRTVSRTGQQTGLCLGCRNNTWFYKIDSDLTINSRSCSMLVILILRLHYQSEPKNYQYSTEG